MTEQSTFIVPIEVSGRHVHLTRQDVETLFGPGARLHEAKRISQPDQYVAVERITVEGPKGTLKKVAIIGPERDATQLEISRTDSFALGIAISCVLSGVSTVIAEKVQIIGTVGTIEIRNNVIIPMRHLHLDPAEAEKHGLKDMDVVSVAVDGGRSIIFHKVIVRSRGNVDVTSFMVDTDEANAAGISKGTTGTVIFDKHD